MTDLIIKPAPLEGKVLAPPSKSMAHRLIIAGSIAHGQSQIENIQLSDDIRATLSAMSKLGASISCQPELQHPHRYHLEIQGLGLKSTDLRPYSQGPIDAKESGTSLRLLIPLTSFFEGPHRFIGQGKLGQRPLNVYQEIYQDQDLVFDQRQANPLDLLVDGQLTAGQYQLPGNVSSQFISGLLFSLPLLPEDSLIQITTAIESKAYIDLTLQVLELYGVHGQFNPSKREIFIPGGQSFQAQNSRVEADYSQAAFFLGAAALGQNIKVAGLNPHSLQADSQIIPLLNQWGAGLKWEGGVLVSERPVLKSHTSIDGSQIPDIIPLLAGVAALTEGQTVIQGLSRLRIKESDRLAACQEEISRLGGHIKIVGDDLVIQGQNQLAGGVKVWSHHDHRIAMMLAILSCRCQEAIYLEDADCVSKSYPDFWRDFKELGGDIDEWPLG